VIAKAKMSRPATSVQNEPRDPPQIDAPLDFSAMLERFGGDRQFIAECVGLFLAEMPAALEAIRHAVQSNSALRLSEAAHALKGMTSNFSEAGPARTAAQLDALARTGHLADAPRLVSQLEREMDRLVAAFQTLQPGI
jgi:HPt (histidine-containing phosphotransfer) domain-containing protein